MKIIPKTLLATGGAAAALISAASPALARDRDPGRDHYRDHGGINVGDIIAGAVVIGGIAAAVGAIGKNRGHGDGYPSGGYRDNHRYGYNDGYDRYGYRNAHPRQAVEQCVYAAERAASRYSYGRADVTDIRDIDRTSRGYTVRGRIAVNGQNHGWHNGDSPYGRGWNNDYRGWNSSLRGYDAGSFKCRIEYGRVVDLDFEGIRGLR